MSNPHNQPESAADPANPFADLVESIPVFDPNAPVPEDLFGWPSYSLPGYEEILKLETREVDNYEVKDGETAIYLSQASLWRLVYGSKIGDSQPLMRFRLQDGQIIATAGDIEIRSDVRELPIEVRTSNAKQHPDAFELIVDVDDLIATLHGAAESTIRFIHTADAPTLSVLSGTFERPIELHDSQLPRILRGPFPVDQFPTNGVTTELLLRTLRYLHHFAEADDTGHFRSIEFKSGFAIAGGHNGAGQVVSEDFSDLRFKIDRDYAEPIIKMLKAIKDDAVRIWTSENYVFFESDQCSLAIPQTDTAAHPALVNLLAQEIVDNYEAAFITRTLLRQSLSRAVSDNCETIRLKHIGEDAFIFISTLSGGATTQFKITGTQRKFPFERPNPDFRMHLPLLYASLDFSDATYIEIRSFGKGVIIDNERDGHKARTILPILSVSTRRPPHLRFSPAKFELTPEEIVDDNL